MTSKQIRYTIKNLLKAQGATYAELGSAIELSESTIKQLMTKGHFSMDRLEKIAEWFGLSVKEFFALSFRDVADNYRMTAKQEEALAQNPQAMHVLFLLGAGFKYEHLKERFQWTNLEWQKILLTLDKADFIELHPSGQVRVKTRGPYLWQFGGTLEKTVYGDYLDTVKSFILTRPDENTLQSTVELYLSKQMHKQLNIDLRELLEKYFHLARLETTQSISEDLLPYNILVFMKQLDVWGSVLSQKQKQKKRCRQPFHVYDPNGFDYREAS